MKACAGRTFVQVESFPEMIELNITKSWIIIDADFITANDIYTLK